MRIILANRYFYPDQSATSRMVSSLAFALARQGYPVTVMTSRHYHDRREEKLPARETIRGVQVHRIVTSGFGRRRTVARAMDYLSFHLSASAWWFANARTDDICVVCTDPPLLSVSSALPIVLRRGRLVNWVMDLFPETAIELGVMPPSTMMESLTLALRNWSHRRASMTICPTASMARYLHEAVPGAGRTSVVNHWSDGAEINPGAREDNPLRREWGLGDSFVVGYSGNFGRAHEFETLLDAAERLNKHADIKFLLIGDGQQRAAVEQGAAERRLTNILFKPLQPSAVLSESLGAADVHVVSLLPSLEHCIVPSKFYGVLAAARPTLFVGAADGEVATAVRRSNCGVSVVPGDVERFVDAVLRLKDDPERRATMGANARRLLESAYAMPIGVDAWRRSVAELLPAGWPQPLPTFGDRVPT